METPSIRLVLLVDDEPAIRMIAAEGLEQAGYEVVEAETAEHALKILTTRDDVGVLFTDVNMPGRLDGLDLARLVHRMWPDIRIVVTSGRGLPSPVPDDGKFVQKPYSLTELARAIEDASDKS